MLTALTLTAALASCAPSAAPTPTPSETGFASEAEAFAAAEETYRAYVDALNDVDLSDPATFEPVYALTTGELNEQDRQTFSELHADGTRVSGSTRILDVTYVSVDPSAVVVAACTDVSEVQVFDADGKSLVSEDRPDFQGRTVTLRLGQDGLRLSRLDDGQAGQPCGE